MIRLALFLLLLCPHLTRAAMYGARIDASSQNITGSFTKIQFKNFAGTNVDPIAIHTVMINNRSTGVELVINCSSTASITPPSGSGGNMSIGTGEAWTFPDETGFGNACFMKTFSGSTASSGILIVNAIGD